MKPGKSVDVREEIAEIHTAARSPSPKQKSKGRSRSRSGSRRLSNGHTDAAEELHTSPVTGEPSDKSKRDSWIKSEHESVELPIHDQINQGIMAFVEKEIKKSDKNPAIVFYSHDPSGIDEKFMKTLSRPSSGHKEKRSPSYRKKKRHSSRHRDSVYNDFDVPGSSLSALERVDDYLKEYNKDEVVTLSGELEIEPNDVENNNGMSKELRHKPRKTRRRTRDERQDSNANGKDVSPKVFKSGKSKGGTKPARPTDLTAMLQTLESSMPYHDQYIDNPFSSPSPVTSPNDERLDPFRKRPEKIYMQGGGTFRAVSRDRILESQQSREGDKYLRHGDLSKPTSNVRGRIGTLRSWEELTALLNSDGSGDTKTSEKWKKRISINEQAEPTEDTPQSPPSTIDLHTVQIEDCSEFWNAPGPSTHYTRDHMPPPPLSLEGMPISASPALESHLSFHSVVTMPYVAAYYFFCVLCLMSVLDRLDVTSIDMTRGLQPYFQPIVLVILYTACLLVSTAARMYDDLMVYQYAPYVANVTGNATAATVPSFYHTWTHFSIWRAILSILGLVYFVISNPPDLVFNNLSKLLQFKQSLQSIG